MQAMRITERTGADGILQVRLPLGHPNAEFDVVVLVKPSERVDASMQPPNEAVDDPWTHEMNARRCQLIDQKVQGLLSDTEAKELEGLQSAMRRHLDRISPLPVDGARRLHAELLSKHESAE